METSEKGVLYGVRELMSHGLLKQDWSKGGVLILTPLALDFLKKRKGLYFRDNPKQLKKRTSKKSSSKKTTKKKKTAKKASSKKSASKRTSRYDGGGSDLFSHLKELRRKESKKRRLAAYKIFHDQTLHEMAQVKPQSEEELLALYGVGEAKLKKYGKTFLKAITEFSG
jgi:ATP-dependent DNA helicase RecQ